MNKISSPRITDLENAKVALWSILWLSGRFIWKLELLATRALTRKFPWNEYPILKISKFPWQEPCIHYIEANLLKRYRALGNCIACQENGIPYLSAPNFHYADIQRMNEILNNKSSPRITDFENEKVALWCILWL